ncbi:hypothetical protein D3C80_2014890 [compost metagenome]
MVPICCLIHVPAVKHWRPLSATFWPSMEPPMSCLCWIQTVNVLLGCLTAARTTANFVGISRSAVGTSILKTHWPLQNRFANCAKATNN